MLVRRVPAAVEYDLSSSTFTRLCSDFDQSRQLLAGSSTVA
jgi:hypothetical protein